MKETVKDYVPVDSESVTHNMWGIADVQVSDGAYIRHNTVSQPHHFLSSKNRGSVTN